MVVSLLTLLSRLVGSLVLSISLCCGFNSVTFLYFRIQELLKSENHEEGRVPRTVECELTEDLVDACIPGDVVTVTGIIKVINNYMDIGGGMNSNYFFVSL